MKHKFLTDLRVRCRSLRAKLFFLIVLCLSLEPVAFGQMNVLSRAQFSRFSVVERARFFEPTISRIAAEEQVDPYLLWTIAYNETRFRPWLRSFAGAEGLMQFIPATASRFNLFNPYQPEPAIRAAARYVRFLSNRFGGRVDSILAGYNAGEGSVDAFLTGRQVRAGNKIINAGRITTIGGVPPYRETIGYVARGLVVYRLLRARQMFPGAPPLSVYPPAVSESVARVWLKDPEIGFTGTLLTQISNPFFLNVETATAQNNFAFLQTDKQKPQTKISPSKSARRTETDFQTNAVISSVETVAENPLTDDDKTDKISSASNEVFYEPRTGARYKTRNGKIERMTEGGERIVSETLRAATPPASRARGTFFGGSKNRVLDK